MVFCVSLLGAEFEMPSAIETIATAVLVELRENSSIENTMTTENGTVFADVLICLCCSKDRVPETSKALARMMSFIVKQCQPWHTNAVNTVLKLHQAKSILNSLQIALSRHDISAYIIDFIEMDGLPEWWGSEVTFCLSPRNGETVNCSLEEVCSDSLDRLRSDLAFNFSSLLLTAVWQSSTSMQSVETCQRLLNCLKGPSLGKTISNCLYDTDTNDIMGLETGTTSEAQAECEGLRARLKNEQTQRSSLEARLARIEKALDQECLASNALEQYLETAEREGFEAATALRSAREEGFETAAALRSAREDYQELLADADRRVEALEMKSMEEKILDKADFLRRETELEDELGEVRSTLQQKEEDLRRKEENLRRTGEELQHEKQNRANLATEMEAALGKSNEEVGGDFHDPSTFVKWLTREID